MSIQPCYVLSHMSSFRGEQSDVASPAKYQLSKWLNRILQKSPHMYLPRMHV